MALFGAGSVLSGQSVNWDLLNYHLYNPHAWWTGRWIIDVAPAQIQSFFNPLLHLPYYLAYQHLDHRLLAFVVGAVQGLAIVPLLLLARRVLPSGLSPWLVIAIAAFGVIGPVFLSEVGTVFGDALLGILIIAGLSMTMRTPASGQRLVAAGAVVGLAVGLKLTMAIFVPGVVLASLLMRPIADWWRTLVFLGLGLAVGYTLVAGYWMWLMYQRYDSPLFPFFNQVFQSPWAGVGSFRDSRFLPSGLVDGLFKPLLAAIDHSKALELRYRGPRVLLLFLALPVAVWLLWRGRLAKPVAALLAFSAVTFLVWSFGFGHYRYLVPIEMIAPIALSGLFLGAMPQARHAVQLLLMVLVLTQLAIKIPKWGRADYGDLMLDRDLMLDIQVPENAMVLLAGRAPLAWAALQLPDDVALVRVAGRYRGIGDQSLMGQRVRQSIAEHDGSFWTLVLTSESELVERQLSAFDLRIERLQCRPIQTRAFYSLGSLLMQCPVLPIGQSVEQPL